MKIICVGRNYAAHIEELQNERTEHPVLFLKPDTSILLKKQPFFIPDFSEAVHHEVEVLVKIKKIGKHIDRKFAHKYYDEIAGALLPTELVMKAGLAEIDYMQKLNVYERMP